MKMRSPERSPTSWAACRTTRWPRTSVGPVTDTSSQTEAAWEILQRQIDPWIEDLRRRAVVGLPDAVARLAVGIVDGLHRLEPLTTDEGRLLSWVPDFPREAAQDVIRTLDALAIVRPVADLERVAPGWT